MGSLLSRPRSVAEAAVASGARNALVVLVVSLGSCGEVMLVNFGPWCCVIIETPVALRFCRGVRNL